MCKKYLFDQFYQLNFFDLLKKKHVKSPSELIHFLFNSSSSIYLFYSNNGNIGFFYYKLYFLHNHLCFQVIYEREYKKKIIFHHFNANKDKAIDADKFKKNCG